jgi:hypothetical protein
LAIIKALNSEFYFSKKHWNISYIFLIDYKKATIFNKKFFKDINYFFISNKFKPEIVKEISKYLPKVIEKKTSNIIYLTR